MRILYDILFFFFTLFYLPFFFLKGKHRAGFASRLGKVPSEVRTELKDKRVIWIHAVSVGEIAQAVHLADVLRGKIPWAKFLLTTTTVAGHEVAGKLKSGEDTLLYFPLDFRCSVRSFIRAVKPAAMILMETELWPNLIFELACRRVPVFVMNGRISDRAIVQYKKILFFAGDVVNRLSGIGAQDALMKQRFLELGARPDLVRVTGNMKFDWKPSENSADVLSRMEEVLKRDGGILCIAGSTHEGEEQVLFKMARALRARCPGFRLLVAPRHLHRLPDIERLAAKENFTLHRISKIAPSEDKRYDKESDAVYILDQMGILASAYRMADLVFIGGSLVPVGGHNPVEPAFFEKPILFGPFMNNFREMAEAFKRSGAAREVDALTMERRMEELTSDGDQRKAMGAAAKRLVRLHEGAVEKNIEMFLEIAQP